MIGFQKQLSKQQRGTQSMLQQAVKGFAGGSKPKPIDPTTTDYDIIFVGKSSPHLCVSNASQQRYPDCWVFVILSNTTKENLLLLVSTFRWN